MTKEEFKEAREVCEDIKKESKTLLNDEIDFPDFEVLSYHASRLLPKALDEIERLKEILNTRLVIRMKCLKCGKISVVSNSCQCGGVREEWKKDRSCK